MRGTAYLHIQENQKAIEDFTQAIRINPNCIFAYSNRANARSLAGDKYGAIEDYIQITKINPSNGEIYYKIAIIFYLQKDQINAIDYFNKLLDLYLEESTELYVQKAEELCIKEKKCLCLKEGTLMSLTLEEAHSEEDILILLIKEDGEFYFQVGGDKLSLLLEDDKKIRYSNAIWFIKRIQGIV